MEGAFKLAKALASERGVDEISVIGGAQIYRQAMVRTERIYLTRVDADVDGDVLFPEIDSQDWVETKVGESEKTDKNEHACEYFILDRKGRIRAKGM